MPSKSGHKSGVKFGDVRCLEHQKFSRRIQVTESKKSIQTIFVRSHTSQIYGSLSISVSRSLASYSNPPYRHQPPRKKILSRTACSLFFPDPLVCIIHFKYQGAKLALLHTLPARSAQHTVFEMFGTPVQRIWNVWLIMGTEWPAPNG